MPCAVLRAQLSAMRDEAASNLESAESDLETAIQAFLANIPGQTLDSNQNTPSNQRGVLRYLYNGGLLRLQNSESSASQQVKCATLSA